MVKSALIVGAAIDSSEFAPRKSKVIVVCAVIFPEGVSEAKSRDTTVRASASTPVVGVARFIASCTSTAVPEPATVAVAEPCAPNTLIVCVVPAEPKKPC